MARGKLVSGKPLSPRERGIALIVVTVTIAVLGAVVGDFSYNARVDLEAAANARDQLRAEYLARSGIQLARLLIKVQSSILDRNRQYIGDIQIAEFAPYLIRAFGGDADERAGLGSLLGIDAANLKGLGVGKGGTFDVDMSSDDGRLNLNCGAGINDVAKQGALYLALAALEWPPRYNRIFENSDSAGQFYTRDDVARAIIDWADIDQTRFEPPPATSGSGSEDYRYDAERDPYQAHNHQYDTLEEINLVRGVTDDWWGSFGEMLTVYGGCKVNAAAIKPENWPLMAAIIRATVKDERKNDPLLLDDVALAQLAQQVLGMAKMTGGFQNVNQFVQLISDPAAAIAGMAGLGADAAASITGGQKPVGIPLDPIKVGNLITIGPRRIYRLEAVGSVQRTQSKKIEVHIRALWDSAHYNQNTTSGELEDARGTWVYWRQD